MLEFWVAAGSVFFWMLFGHALADYAWQTTYMAEGKKPVSGPAGSDWWIILFNHAMIHAGAVALATGSLGLGLAELSAHFVIDFQKSSHRFGFRMDQGLHVACKGLWAILYAWSL